MIASGFHEVTININDALGECITSFGVVGDPPKAVGGRVIDDPSPVMLVTPDVVGASLRPGGSEFEGTISKTTRDGVMTIMASNGTWIYNLIPARWSDGKGPAIYLAVWPD